VDRAPALEGKSMFMTLVSVHKPKVHEHRMTAAKDETAVAPSPATESPVPSVQPAESPAPVQAAEPPAGE